MYHNDFHTRYLRWGKWLKPLSLEFGGEGVNLALVLSPDHRVIKWREFTVYVKITMKV